MNRMEGIRFTRNKQNTRSFEKLAGNPTRPLAPVFRFKKLELKFFFGHVQPPCSLTQVPAQT